MKTKLAFKAHTGLLGGTAPGQRVTARNIHLLPPGSVIRNGDRSRIIHLHDNVWLWCCDSAWTYDSANNISHRLDKNSELCHHP